MKRCVTSMFVLVFGLVGSEASAHCGKCGIGEKKHDHARAEIGAPAPSFTLTSIKGEKVSLSDFKSKIIVLEWTNHECPVVKRHVAKKQTMQKTLQRFKDKGVVWLAIDSSHFCEEKLDGVKTFAKENDVSYPVLLDASGKVGRAYEAKTTPHMFVIDQKGVLVYSGAIDDDKTFRKPNVRNYVADAVEAVLNGSTVSVSSTEPYGCSVKYAK